MRKLILSFVMALSFFMGNVVFAAEALIFNMSERHDMVVYYKLCNNRDAGTATCTSMQTVTIQSKNFTTFKPLPDLNSIVIHSAIEKDGCGHVVSHGEYWYSSGNLTSCRANMVEGPITYAGIIVLNDMNESPYILCTTDIRQVHSHN